MNEGVLNKNERDSIAGILGGTTPEREQVTEPKVRGVGNISEAEVAAIANILSEASETWIELSGRGFLEDASEYKAFTAALKEAEVKTKGASFSALSKEAPEDSVHADTSVTQLLTISVRKEDCGKFLQVAQDQFSVAFYPSGEMPNEEIDLKGLTEDEDEPDFDLGEPGPPLRDDEEYFSYLDELRTSGVTNMFGAGAYLEREFGIDSREAKRVLLKWMETFSERHPRESLKEASMDTVGTPGGAFPPEDEPDFDLGEPDDWRTFDYDNWEAIVYEELIDEMGIPGQRTLQMVGTNRSKMREWHRIKVSPRVAADRLVDLYSESKDKNPDNSIESILLCNDIDSTPNSRENLKTPVVRKKLRVAERVIDFAIAHGAQATLDRLFDQPPTRRGHKR